ncbi:hypothetical protein LPH56_05585 [Xylella taiwanensis]|uniref:hypothetical protein n=1 Tax=Xylella taiwanensis TaxID=1444770 RepID=UPI001E484F11|nr:hypothetical protein [Xylella taiwanensis]UFS52857.1 hypothetical protein LPH56_05585 [Xylella taiwanensis]
MAEWDHQNVPFNRACALLDGLLDWRALHSWPYRNVLGYLLRSQEDFRDVFKLGKFVSKDVDWKPFLAHLLGFNEKPVTEYYKKTAELDHKKNEAKGIRNTLDPSIDSLGNIEEMRLLK